MSRSVRERAEPATEQPKGCANYEMTTRAIINNSARPSPKPRPQRSPRHGLSSGTSQFNKVDTNQAVSVITIPTRAPVRIRPVSRPARKVKPATNAKPSSEGQSQSRVRSANQARLEVAEARNCADADPAEHSASSPGHHVKLPGSWLLIALMLYQPIAEPLLSSSPVALRLPRGHRNGLPCCQPLDHRRSLHFAGEDGFGLAPLLVGGEPARTASLRDAVGVSVSTSTRIPLGNQQHVFAHRVELEVAERANVGRWLQVLRTARLPPSKTLRVGHSDNVSRPSAGNSRPRRVVTIWWLPAK